MTTIYLIRHSNPEKGSNLSNEEIPLSIEGIETAKNKLSNNLVFLLLKIFLICYNLIGSR